jgi:hypothetical protein
MATKTIEQELIEREHTFWDAMKGLDGDKAASMSDKQVFVAGAHGIAAIEPKLMAEMMKSPTWQLHSYKMDEKDMHVRVINDNVALVAYKVIEDLSVDGRRLTLEAYDTSVWVRHGNDWLCAMHTESLAGDPFGRDKTRPDS